MLLLFPACFPSEYAVWFHPTEPALAYSVLTTTPTLSWHARVLDPSESTLEICFSSHSPASKSHWSSWKGPFAVQEPRQEQEGPAVPWVSLKGAWSYHGEKCSPFLGQGPENLSPHFFSAGKTHLWLGVKPSCLQSSLATQILPNLVSRSP